MLGSEVSEIQDGAVQIQAAMGQIMICVHLVNAAFSPRSFLSLYPSHTFTPREV